MSIISAETAKEIADMRAQPWCYHVEDVLSVVSTLEDHIELLEQRLVALQSCKDSGSEMLLEAIDIASELFQPGGKFADALTIGDSCLIDGLKWMANEITAFRTKLKHAEEDAAMVASMRRVLGIDMYPSEAIAAGPITPEMLKEAAKIAGGTNVST